MTEYLFLFHSTLGVVKTRRALQAAAIDFRVTDIPRQLRGGCGLCIWIACAENGYQEWVMAGLTESVYRVEGEQWICEETYPSP